MPNLKWTFFLFDSIDFSYTVKLSEKERERFCRRYRRLDDFIFRLDRFSLFFYILSFFSKNYFTLSKERKGGEIESSSRLLLNIKRN